MWLYLPTSYRSVPGAAALTSDYESLFQVLEQSATWKTKSRPAASWRHTWKRHPWTQRLFGQTYVPLTANRGAASWISSLAATRASRSATQESSLARLTPVTCGPRCSESCQRCSPSSASSRTSALICDSDSTKSPEAFKAWATVLRQHCLKRRKSALLTGASGCSSWPTAKAVTGMYQYARGDHSKPVLNLEGAARMRQTPTSAAEAPNLGSNIKNGPKSLLAQAQWMTPRAVDANGVAYTYDQGDHSRPRPSLTGQAQRATPTSRDWKDGANPSAEVATNSLLGRQAPRTPMPGDESLQSDETSRRRLNPRFVEWLMGWPEGWVALTSSTS